MAGKFFIKYSTSQVLLKRYVLSNNSLHFWFPGGAMNWQSRQIVRDVPPVTYQIFAKITWLGNFLSSILLPRCG